MLHVCSDAIPMNKLPVMCPSVGPSCVWHIKNTKMFLVFTDVLKNVFPTLTVKGLSSGTFKKIILRKERRTITESKCYCHAESLICVHKSLIHDIWMWKDSLCSEFLLFATICISQSHTHTQSIYVCFNFIHHMGTKEVILYFGDHVIFLYKYCIDSPANIWYRYNCNRYDEEEAKAARDAQERSRAALQRYLFYCNRYMNHMQSLKFEHKLYASVKEKMEEMQQHNMSWIEVITYFL